MSEQPRASGVADGKQKEKGLAEAFLSGFGELGWNHDHTGVQGVSAVRWEWAALSAKLGRGVT